MEGGKGGEVGWGGGWGWGAGEGRERLVMTLNWIDVLWSKPMIHFKRENI